MRLQYTPGDVQDALSASGKATPKAKGAMAIAVKRMDLKKCMVVVVDSWATDGCQWAALVSFYTLSLKKSRNVMQLGPSAYQNFFIEIKFNKIRRSPTRLSRSISCPATYLFGQD